MFGVSKGANTTGLLSTGNTSTTPLGSVGTFTGSYISCVDFPSIAVAVLTDKRGTLYVDFSNDAITAQSTLSFTVTASLNEVHRIAVTRSYVRLRFTNDSGEAQGSFDISLILGYQSSLTSSISSTIQSDADGIITRPLDFNFMVAEGLYQNRANTIKDGYTPTLTSGALTQDIWTESGAYTGFPASPASSELVIAGADTGTVYYSYMASDTDTDYTMASKAITGINTYSLGHNIWRCNFMYFVTSNVTAFNAGKMTIRHTATPANIFCTIEAGRSQSYCSAYTVPYQSSIYLDRVTGDMRGGVSGSLDGFFWYRGYNESPRLRFPFELQFGALYFDDIDYLVKIPERTDIVPRLVNASANNLTGKFAYRFIRVKTI